MPSDYNAITEHNEDQLGKDTSTRNTQVSMYSDPTHFVYEILQNADDHGATKVLFKLSKNEIVIEHNGEPFKEKHVKAITYFGEGTSREDPVKNRSIRYRFQICLCIHCNANHYFVARTLPNIRSVPCPRVSLSRRFFKFPYSHNSTVQP